MANSQPPYLMMGILGLNIFQTSPESRVASLVANHPAAVTAACAYYAKGACVAVKAVKHGASVISSKPSATATGTVVSSGESSAALQ